jgi:hypothetical protein
MLTRLEAILDIFFSSLFCKGDEAVQNLMFDLYTKRGEGEQKEKKKEKKDRAQDEMKIERKKF